MPFSHELRAALPSEFDPPSEQAGDRVDLFASVSAVYAGHLRQRPQDWVWLDDPDTNRDWSMRDFIHLWKTASQGLEENSPAWYGQLRRLRRRMLLRIAYRDVCALAPMRQTLREQSALAEFVLGVVLDAVIKSWIQRLGEPWNEEADAPARWCVLALGKLGGRELNFFSDLDLIFFFEGSGTCRKQGAATQVSNEEFYARAFREACGKLQEPSPYGPLYHIDLRLRPEGDSGPLVRRFSGLLHYYWTLGQTWERLAWIRARPVAGDLSLGGELLEEMNAFRYPRSTSPKLLQEVAGVKLRTEREVVGAGLLGRDIKSGVGGIREIEFFVQAHQLVNGGRNPFLQSASTEDALERLARYGFIDERTRAFLFESYLFLRTVENRLQQYDEQQVHVLPPADDPWRSALARSLGFAKRADFEAHLNATRAGVREIYLGYFGLSTREDELQQWVAFLGGEAPSEPIAKILNEWFAGAPDIEKRVRQFALGGPTHAVTREQVSLFLDVAQTFAKSLPKLSRPLRTLERLGSFAERYGARKQFFKAAVDSPDLFEALSLVFDRSTFIHALMCKHPEIMEELLHTSRNRNKSREDLSEEISLLPKTGDFPRLLWLYVKAEQVRLAMGQALYNWPRPEVEKQLSRLADAALEGALVYAQAQDTLSIVALGKYGGEELGFGSDLDLLVLSNGGDLAQAQQAVTEFTRALSFTEPMGKTYELDLRLRPHGQDGPLAATLEAFKRYHQGGGAQDWERQVLTRARAVFGKEALFVEFFKARDEIVFERGANESVLRELWAMRLRVQEQKTRGITPPSRSFKAAEGGLMDLEFFAQMTQMRMGKELPQLRSPSSADVLAAAAGLWGENRPAFARLPEHYDYLRRVEMCLRRDSFSGVSLIPEPGRDRYSLAWGMGFADEQSFVGDYEKRLARIRADVLDALREIGLSTL